MTETLLTWLAVWGGPILAIVVILSCLALPLPSSIVMLTCGSLVAAGDMSLMAALITAIGGAIFGDQLGYWIGRRYGPMLRDRFDRTPPRRKLWAKAQRFLNTSGVFAVFLSRWLFSPLGPYVNFIAGSARYSWPKYTLSAALGECVWVGLYITLGYIFGDNIDAASEFASSISGLLAALAATGALFWYAGFVLRHHRK